MKRLALTRRKTAFLLVVLAGALIWASLSHQREADRGLVILGPVTLTNNQFQITVTNISERVISHELSSPHFRRADEWGTFSLLSFHYLPNGQRMVIMPEKLSPKAAQVLSGTTPRYISAPFEATAWRVAVVWSYDEQTFWEKHWYQFLTRLQGQVPYPLPVLHTNYSPEVPIGSSRLPKHLYP